MRYAAATCLIEERSCAPAPDFNRLAHVYRWMEWFSFGPFLSRCRCAFLPSLPDRRTALVLGDGDGRFTARLLHHNARIAVDAVDASDAMLRELARRATPDALRLQTIAADAREFVPPRRSYDLLFTHFFLDCLNTTEVEALASRLRRHVNQNSLWIVSDFAVPRGWFGRLIAQPLITALYLAFGWLTGLSIRRLPDHHQALMRAGWSLHRERRFLHGLLVAQLWRPN